MNILHGTQCDVGATAWLGDNGRVFMEVGSSTLTMTTNEARDLAASLTAAANAAQPFVLDRRIVTGNADLVEGVA